MTIDARRLRDWRWPPVHQSLTVRDTILYALGVGCGADPTDPRELRHVYEDGLQALPTMAVTLCYPAMLADFAHAVGIRPESVLHVAQGFELAAPLPVAGEFVGTSEVTGVFDKGVERGTLWTYRNRIVDAGTGAPVCELTAASIARGHGGWGGERGVPPPTAPWPSRAPDAVVTFATAPQAALLYRLSGDWNPLHADPRAARRGGLPAPILHGRCTFGVAGRALLRAFCDDDATRLRAMSARFAAVVFPGDTIRTEAWRDGDTVRFRARVPARDAVVLDDGLARLVD